MRISMIGFAGALLLSVTAGPGAIAASKAGPDPVGSATGYYGSVADLPSSVSALAASPAITAGSCEYEQRTDDVHFSGTGWAASGHGWWMRSAGTCPSKANADIELQAVWCDQYGCRWRTVASGSKDVYAGGGSANRAAAREDCGGSKTVGWRLRVDVDLLAVSDPSGWTYSSGRDLACYPSS